MDESRLGDIMQGKRSQRYMVIAGLMLLVIMALPAMASLGPFLITMESWSPYYQPLEATVQPHSPIQWMNSTASPHTIRHDRCLTGSTCAFDSGAVPPNGTYVIPGLPPGRYSYHCEIHPIMRGELIVEHNPPIRQRS
jgi:hypothetical protein